jgi:predicted TPR repeat methyltransferase
MGEALEQSGNIPKAVQCFENLLEFDPMNNQAKKMLSKLKKKIK